MSGAMQALALVYLFDERKTEAFLGTPEKLKTSIFALDHPELIAFAMHG